jgi:hypothetical protein
MVDSLSNSVNVISPADQAPGIDPRNVNLIWEATSSTTNYEWQLDYDSDFLSLPFKGSTNVSIVRLSAQLRSATTYYWRVRATEPLLTPWSATRTFTTSLGTGATAPILKTPGAAAKNIETKPIFQWSALAGAEGYELMVARDAAFGDLVINRTGSQTLPSTAWQSDTSLDYATTYYWKVKGYHRRDQ